MVGVVGFEPTISCSQSTCDARLRYTPGVHSISEEHGPPEPGVRAARIGTEKDGRVGATGAWAVTSSQGGRNRTRAWRAYSTRP